MKKLNQNDIDNIIEYNSQLFHLSNKLKNYKKKYKLNFNFVENFHYYIELLYSKDISDDNKQILQNNLINPSADFAYLYCSAYSDLADTKFYKKYFDYNFNLIKEDLDLLNNVLFIYAKPRLFQVLYSLKFNYNNYNISSDIESQIPCIYAYRKEIFDRYGKAMFKKCKRGHELIILYFMYFQEWFTDEMFEIFIDKMYKCLASNKWISLYIFKYLNSSLIRNFPDPYKEELKAKYIIYKL